MKSGDALSGKKIVLGITGCISAYKSCFLIRELVKRGAEVKVVATKSAFEFITPLTLATLSRNDVVVSMFPKGTDSEAKTTTWHIDLGIWADIMIIAPASVNSIAKIAHGICDNPLTTLVTALRCPLLVCPTADVDMYQARVTQENIEKLRGYGFHILDAEAGELASGLTGKGRLPETSKITDKTEQILSGYKEDLSGKRVLVTAGPTYEDIDPVRYLGNRSSGKMGFELAKAAYLRGAEVLLISGPTSERAYQEIPIIRVRSAAEMKTVVDKSVKNSDILIMAAAVADFKPSKKSENKIKKEENPESIRLEKTEDILTGLKTKAKSGETVKVGFALETENEEKNAIKKLKGKGLDLIVLNSLRDEKSGFEYDTNKIKIIDRDKTKEFPLMSKFQVANVILTEAAELIKKEA